MNDLELGGKIRSLRKTKGMTQDELAKALGVTAQAVSKWERGLSFPELPLLPLLADCLECKIDALFREEAPSVEAAVDLPQIIEDPLEMQRACLRELCRVCIQEGDAAFEQGKYECALLAYTKGVRGVEAFLTPGEDGLAAYPWEELVEIHWTLYLRRAECYEHLLREEDCQREAEMARTIQALTEPIVEDAPEEAFPLLRMQFDWWDE